MQDYNQQAKDFLYNTFTSIDLTFLGKKLHFVDDKEKRNVYQIRIYHEKTKKEIFFDYGDSINNTNKAIRKRPSDYDILSSISLPSSDSFEDFCDNFGYDSDSIKAKKIYEDCTILDKKISSIYTSEELDLLQEIV